MEAPELVQITRSIRNAMGEGLGGFRQAATQNNQQIQKIIKDISSVFSRQKSDISTLADTMEESLGQGQQTAFKIDRMTSILQESVSTLTNMLAELKNLSYAIRSLQEQNSMISQALNGGAGGGKSVVSALFDLFSPTSWAASLKDALANTALTIAGGAGGLTLGFLGAAGADYAGRMMGRDTGSGPMDSMSTNPIKASGNLKENQQEAYKAAKAEGLSDTAARALVANMSGEGLKNPSAFNKDYNSRGEFVHMARGIVQWDPERSEAIKATFGKYPNEMTVAEQTKAAIWEMKNNKRYAETWQTLNNPQASSGQMIDKLVRNYERPANPDKDVQTRMGYYQGFTPSAQTSQNEQSQPTPQSSPMSSGSAESAENTHEKHADKQGGEHPGILSGATGEPDKNAGQVLQEQKGTRNLPINDRLLKVLESAAAKAGVTVHVTSGAQPDYPKGPRTGSTRHDVSVGAADLHLSRNGKTLSDNNPEDVKVKRMFAEAAVAAGATGIGAAEGYMGPETMHVGFGKPAIWGTGGHSGGAASWLSGLNVGGGSGISEATGGSTGVSRAETNANNPYTMPSSAGTPNSMAAEQLSAPTIIPHPVGGTGGAGGGGMPPSVGSFMGGGMGGMPMGMGIGGMPMGVGAAMIPSITANMIGALAASSPQPEETEERASMQPVASPIQTNIETINQAAIDDSVAKTNAERDSERTAPNSPSPTTSSSQQQSFGYDYNHPSDKASNFSWAEKFFLFPKELAAIQFGR